MAAEVDTETPAAPGRLADRRVADELFRTARAADRRAVLVTVLASLFVMVAVQGGAGPKVLWLWCVACALLSLARLGTGVARGTAGSPAATRGPGGEAVWLALVCVAAAVWGVGPPLILASSADRQALVTAIWLAIAGLSLPLLAASRAAIYLWLLPALGPLVLALALQRTTAAMLLAGLSAAFLVALLRLALEQNDALALGLLARFQNEDLVGQLRTQVEVAARANQEKTRFIASAAHDLRQPLHALGLFCAALDQRLKNIPEKPLIRSMLESIEALERSFGAMLDISRLDAGIVAKDEQAFPIRDLFRRLYQQFGGDAESRRLALRFRAARRAVRSDPQLLERVLANLLQNAMRYTKQGGVLVAARRHPDGVALEVRDSGMGIPADQLEMVFREFYQVDNPERDRTRGLGMGLAIVQRLCALLGHRLEVRSAPGRGSVFRVIVPSASDSAGTAEAPPLEADTLPPRTEPRVTVLLIDDERAVREATTELLQPTIADVIAVATIGEAVEAATRAGVRIDLILSDWRLRGRESGIDAVREVRAAIGESTPAVLVTGETSPELLKLAHESGLVLLHKPLQPRELVGLIERMAR